MKSTSTVLTASVLPALLVAALLTSVADAAVITTFSSRANFEAALANPLTFDFNQPNGPVANLGSELTVSTVGGDASGQILNNGLCGSVGGGADCFPPVLFTFAQPGFAFGFDNLDFTSDEEAVVTFSFTNGDASQSFVFDLGGAPSFTPIFFGATSDVAISTVEIFSRDPGSTQVGARANLIDNVTVDAAVVPEPGSLALLGLGLGLAGLGGRRRARA